MTTFDEGGLGLGLEWARCPKCNEEGTWENDVFECGACFGVFHRHLNQNRSSPPNGAGESLQQLKKENIMQISDFIEPKSHPFGMLSGYDHASEKESVLAFILSKCVATGDFVVVETVHSHPTMVSDGLLEEVGERQYKLTKKAIGLLYSQYAR